MPAVKPYPAVSLNPSGEDDRSRPGRRLPKTDKRHKPPRNLRIRDARMVTFIVERETARHSPAPSETLIGLRAAARVSTISRFCARPDPTRAVLGILRANPESPIGKTPSR